MAMIVLTFANNTEKLVNNIATVNTVSSWRLDSIYVTKLHVVIRHMVELGSSDNDFDEKFHNMTELAMEEPHIQKVR